MGRRALTTRPPVPTTTPAPPQALEVRAVRLDTLTPDPHNVRLHPEKNVKAIMDSLAAFGQQKPVIVDTNGTILAGNGAYLAARRLGWEWITVQVSQLTPDQARAYALADNRTGELSLWDDAALADLLRDLSARELPLPGWDEAELRRLCDAGEMQDVQPDLARANELRQQYGVELGQVWLCGRHRLGCGDCTDEQVVKAVLTGTVPRLMVTDPPYGVNYNPTWRDDAGGVFGDGKTVMRGRVDNDDSMTWQAAYALFPGDVAYVWHAGIYAGEVAQQLAACRFLIRTQIVWLKQHFVLSRGAYHWQHEPCWYAVRQGRGAHWCGDRTQSTTWEIASMNPAGGSDEIKTGHGTQKPLECMARPIRNHDAPAVYDPFLGSGTTLVACENLSRRCYAIDIDPAYVAVALHRWATLTGETPSREA